MVRRLLLVGLVLACGVTGVWSGSGGASLWGAAPIANCAPGTDTQLRTVVIRPERSQSGALSIMVVHSERFAVIARETVGAGVTPLILTVSALAPEGAWFDPDRIRVAQGGREWKPVVAGEERDVFSLDGQHAVGGLLADNEVRQVVLLLPEWIDVTQPMALIYGSAARILRFPQSERSLATRR